MKYTIILMDSDNTILNYSRSEKKALNRTLKSYGINPAKKIELYRQINDSIWKKHERGEIAKSEIGRERFSQFFKHLGLNVNPSEFNDKYMQNLSNTKYMIKGALGLLKKLNEMGARVYLVTNGTEWIQHKRIGSLPVKDYLSDIFVSERAGYSKPDIRYFEYCFERIPDFDKSKCLLVGDSATADIQGAINAGVDSCHFCPGSAPSQRATYTVKRLKDILKLIN